VEAVALNDHIETELTATSHIHNILSTTISLFERLTSTIVSTLVILAVLTMRGCCDTTGNALDDCWIHWVLSLITQCDTGINWLVNSTWSPLGRIGALVGLGCWLGWTTLLWH